MPPLPMRPLKLRLVVEAHTSPSARTPLLMPRQAPQVGLVTQKPASMKTSMSPSSSAWRKIFGRGRADDAAHTPGCDLAALEHAAALAQVLDAAVGAGADIDLVDAGCLPFPAPACTWSGL